MTRSRWRTFLTVFLVVFLGGLGVSGAAALWSMQTNVTAEVATGTWDPSPTPSPTQTPTASPSATPTPTPPASATPTAPASPIPTPTSVPPPAPWNPCVSATVLDKNNPVRIKLAWSAQDGYTVERLEVHDGKNGNRSVAMSPAGGAAEISLPNGTADYHLIFFFETASGQSQQIERILSFQPAGKEGEVSISPNACG